MAENKEKKGLTWKERQIIALNKLSDPIKVKKLLKIVLKKEK